MPIFKYFPTREAKITNLLPLSTMEPHTPLNSSPITQRQRPGLNRQTRLKMEYVLAGTFLRTEMWTGMWSKAAEVMRRFLSQLKAVIKIVLVRMIHVSIQKETASRFKLSFLIRTKMSYLSGSLIQVTQISW